MTLFDYRLADIGEGLAEAEVVKWLVAVGDRVERDQILVELETDKMLVEMPAPVSGVIESLGANEGESVAVGDTLAVIETNYPPRQSDTNEKVSRTVHSPDLAPVHADTPIPDGSPPPRRVKASPATRKLAASLNVDPSTLSGSGPGGRITKGDVEGAAHVGESQQHERTDSLDRGDGRSQDVTTEPLRGIRRKIAQTMSESAAIPIIYEWRDVDASALLTAREGFRSNPDPLKHEVTLLHLVIMAVAAATARNPTLNATFDNKSEEISYHRRVNIGVATSTPNGVVVPVVHDAGRRNIVELAAEVGAVVEKTRDHTVDAAALRGGTITVSNYGSFGTRHGTPLIRPPEVTIVGVGRVHESIVARAGEPVVTPVLPLTVGTDHRVNDGAQLASFCNDLQRLLEEPIPLLAGEAAWL